MKASVLVYRLGSLGDTVVALPALHLVRHAFPHARITLLTNRPVAVQAAPLDAVLQGSGLYDDILDYPVGTRSPVRLANLAWQIRRRRIETVVNLCAARSSRTARRDAVFFRLAGVRRIIGSPRASRDFAVARDEATGLYEAEAARLVRRLTALGGIDLDVADSWDLRLSAAEKEQAKVLLGDDPAPRIVASVGTKMPAKDWEEKNWRELLAALGSDWPGYRLILVGAASESARAEQCAAAWGSQVTNLCGVASPRVAAAAMAGARVFVGHDSGPMHLAAAMQVPCVAIFSARNLPGHWFPHGSRHEVLYHQTECFGCNLEVCVEERKRCILGISVEEARSAVRRVLSREPETNVHDQ